MINRQRGVVLTQPGLARLQGAITAAQDQEKYGQRFTQAELEARAGISRKTIKKILAGTTPVDVASVQLLFTGFGLPLDAADHGLPDLPSPSTSPEGTSPPPQTDWAEKPDTTVFFGREPDMATLGQWVTVDSGPTVHDATVQLAGGNRGLRTAVGGGHRLEQQQLCHF